MREIQLYKTSEGKCPFEKWYSGLDKSVQMQITRRMARILEGNKGDFKWIDDDISELKFTTGKGYRIYFSEIDDIIILFLSGGDKSNQSKDIKKAKEYYKDHIERMQK